MALVLQTIDFRDIDAGYRALMPRGELDVEEAVQLVRPLAAGIRERGVAALAEYSKRFDGVVPSNFRVAAADLQRSLDQLDPQLKQAFEVAIGRRRQVALAEGWAPEQHVAPDAGARVSVRTVPVRRVGLYAPGGLAPLASSVLMNVIPAQVARVSSIAVASPPQKEFGGLPHPTVLAMCALLGVDEVYAVGGAQAIAMFAYGVPGLCEAVDLVTGPGNIFVVAAKRLLRGVVGIDSEAGPTEIAILADADANPAYVAADLISQAEHDPMAASVLVTDSSELITAVNAQIGQQVAATKHIERVTTALTGPQSAAILVRDLEQGLQVVDAYAAEHLEIQTANAAQIAASVQNAGAIFVGPYSPVPLGDYTAGSTHVLPTSGTAAFASGLTVRSFMRTIHVVDYSKEALLRVADVVERFGVAEDLPAHAFAATVRRGE